MRQLGWMPVGLLAFGLCGCVTLQADPAVVNSAGYEAGYADGCTTGQKRQDYFSREIVRDKERFKSEKNYQIGWRDGFNECGGRVETSDPYGDSTDRWMTGGPHG